MFTWLVLISLFGFMHCTKICFMVQNYDGFEVVTFENILCEVNCILAGCH